jgi:hypothetical protein
LKNGFRKLGASSLFKNKLMSTSCLRASPRRTSEVLVRHSRRQSQEDGRKQKGLGSTAYNSSWFVLFAVDRIRKLMNKKTQDIRSHSGLVYGFFCDLDESNHLIKIMAKNDQSASFSTVLLEYAKIETGIDDKALI